MLEVVCAVVCGVSVVVMWFLLRRADSSAKSNLDSYKKLFGERDQTDLELMESLAGHQSSTVQLGAELDDVRGRLDAIEARLPKPRTPRKRKGNALKAAVDAVVALDADS